MSEQLDKHYIARDELCEQLAHLSERFEAGSDVRNALIGASSASRQLMETITRLHHSSVVPAETDDLLRALRDHGIIESSIAKKIQIIQILGGHASGGNHGVPLTREDGQTVLAFLKDILVWYFCDSEIGPEFNTLEQKQPDPEGDAIRETIQIVSANPEFVKSKVWERLDSDLLAEIEQAIQEAKAE